MKKLTISQMAKANNISEQTLRLYDKIGLLKPECVNEQTGYRYYSITQSACLDMIQYMKALGMSLGQIKEQLDLNNISLIEKLLLCQNTRIDRQIENLTITKCARYSCLLMIILSRKKGLAILLPARIFVSIAIVFIKSWNMRTAF
jgi:DNA-binding transcriptional MerR regulator